MTINKFYSPQPTMSGGGEQIPEADVRALIHKHIGKMWGSCEMASIDYFKETGTINGSFLLRLKSLLSDAAQLMIAAPAESARNYKKAFEDLNASLDAMWNTPGISQIKADCLIKRVSEAQSIAYNELTSVPAKPAKESHPEDVEKTLGQTLKEIRESKGVTPKSVLKETGVSNEYLRKLEADELKTPSAGVLWKLAQYYEADLKPLCIKAGIIIKAPPSPPSVKPDVSDIDVGDINSI